MFAELIQPHFEREAEVIHPSGKRTMNHMDGFLKSIIDSIAACPIDIVEAFNPTPDGNVSVAEARAAWSKKGLSINFPSSVHLRPKEEIRKTTIDILRQAAPGKDFIMGVTEDVPARVVEESLATIAETLNEFGAYPIDVEKLPA
jgi:hypothetical protein